MFLCVHGVIPLRLFGNDLLKQVTFCTIFIELLQFISVLEFIASHQMFVLQILFELQYSIAFIYSIFIYLCYIPTKII